MVGVGRTLRTPVVTTALTVFKKSSLSEIVHHGFHKKLECSQSKSTAGPAAGCRHHVSVLKEEFVASKGQAGQV